MRELVYLGIGSNIGDRETNIFTAIAALDIRAEIRVVRCLGPEELRGYS